MLVPSRLSLLEQAIRCVGLEALVVVEYEGSRLVERLYRLDVDDVDPSEVLLLGSVLLLDLQEVVILLCLVCNEPKLIAT